MNKPIADLQSQLGSAREAGYAEDSALIKSLVAEIEKAIDAQNRLGDSAAEVAKSVAERILREAGDKPEAQITRAFTLILQRLPAAGEIETCLPLWRDRSLAEVCRVLLNTSEFLVVD